MLNTLFLTYNDYAITQLICLLMRIKQYVSITKNLNFNVENDEL